MGYGRKRFELKEKRTSTFGLNITSMTDMFTILLVFLLQTYSTNDVQIIPEKGLKLPISNSEANPVRAIQLTISKTELKIEGRTIASVNDNDINKADIDRNDPNFILPLFNELDKLSKELNRKTAEAKKEEGTGTTPTKAAYNEISVVEGRILLQADSELPYSTLRKVMYTASHAGFPKLKLATVVGE